MAEMFRHKLTGKTGRKNVFYCREQSPSSDSNNLSACQEILRLSSKSTVHYCVHKFISYSPTLVLETDFSVFFLFMPTSPKRTFPLKLSV
jgi:hypothetical protein